MPDDFSKLGADGFESLSQALALCVLGPGITVFGDGPDGGREASFDGQVNFPDAQNAWFGYGVLQAKYKARLGDTGVDNRWFLKRVKEELHQWGKPAKRRTVAGRRPQYFIFTTNVPLSSTPGSGGKDAFDALMREHQQQLDLSDWRIWDADQISRLLDRYPDLRASYAGLLTTNEVLGHLMKQLSSPVAINLSSVPGTAHLAAAGTFVRPGEPGNESAFQEAFDAAGGADLLGNAQAPVEQFDGGYLQRFGGGYTGTERVLCAPASHPVVAMDRAVWEQIQSVGGRHGGVEHIGFPLAPPTGRPYIGPDWTEILLVGGDWARPRNDERRGRLVRRADGVPVWQPEVVFDDEASRTRGWRVDHREPSTMDLRLATSGQILIRGDDLQITENGRDRMLEAVAVSGLDDLLNELARRWKCSSGSGWAEITEDFRITHVPGDLAVSFDEVLNFIRTSWYTTTYALLLAVTPDPSSLVPAGASRMEIYIENERPENTGSSPTRRLLEMVDLARFGRSRIAAPRSLACGITTPIALTTEQIRPHAAAAFDHIARSFGFTQVPGKGPG